MWASEPCPSFGETCVLSNCEAGPCFTRFSQSQQNSLNCSLDFPLERHLPAQKLRKCRMFSGFAFHIKMKGTQTIQCLKFPQMISVLHSNIKT